LEETIKMVIDEMSFILWFKRQITKHNAQEKMD